MEQACTPQELGPQTLKSGDSRMAELFLGPILTHIQLSIAKWGFLKEEELPKGRHLCSEAPAVHCHVQINAQDRQLRQPQARWEEMKSGGALQGQCLQ